MSLYLVRLPFDAPMLLRFAREHGIGADDETLGYLLHAWLKALFGEHAPKPFRYREQRHRNTDAIVAAPRDVLAYSALSHDALLEHARLFASPLAWAALDEAGVASKCMPKEWRAGQRLRMEVLACPVSRKDDEEKDIYLRVLEREGDSAPSRAEVYRRWFQSQWHGSVSFESIEMVGMVARSRLLRRARNDGNRLRVVERPQATFLAQAVIENPMRFVSLLARGIGRHRAFGFGMVLLAPPA